MAASVLVDTSFLVALLSSRDAHHSWAVAEAPRQPPPWVSCEAVLSETFYLLGSHGGRSLAELLRRGALTSVFQFSENADAVLGLLEKYGDVPMSFAEACLVRMTETLNDPVLLTTDADFHVYRRHSRQTIPCVLPR